MNHMTTFNTFILNRITDTSLHVHELHQAIRYFYLCMSKGQGYTFTADEYAEYVELEANLKQIYRE